METKNYFLEKTGFYLLKPIVLVLIMLMLSNKTECQKTDEPVSFFKGGSYEKTFSTSRIGVVQTVMTTPKAEFHVVIQHRFGEIRTGAYELFGLDGAYTRIGFDYGIFNWLSAGIGRSLLEKTYDLEFKAVILKQDDNIPVSLSYYTSFMSNTLKNVFLDSHNNFRSRLRFGNQLFISRNQGIFSFQVSPLWLHSNYDLRKRSAIDVYAIDLDARIRIFEKLGVFTEYIPILTKEPFITTNPLTFGIDINLGGHQFQLFFSNSQGTNEESVLTNTDGRFSHGHFYFGFNLTRVFNSKM